MDHLVTLENKHIFVLFNLLYKSIFLSALKSTKGESISTPSSKNVK